jgi:hypothetical protein
MESHSLNVVLHMSSSLHEHTSRWQQPTSQCLEVLFHDSTHSRELGWGQHSEVTLQMIIVADRR